MRASASERSCSRIALLGSLLAWWAFFIYLHQFIIVDYKQFIESKKRLALPAGIMVDSLNPLMKDFQAFSTKIALKHGRFALFEDCGLGKTLQQLEFAYHVANHTGKKNLILAPNAVVAQTINEAKKFGYGTLGDNGIDITNYEKLETLDVSEYSGVVLDESSILKNHEGAYRNLIMDKFKHTTYKLACTATPGPNDPMELGNHSEFLGYMTRNEMLSTYFVHDGGDTDKWRIKGHAVDKFWQFIASFSLMFSKPSHIGFSDDGYVLPPLNYIEKQIITDQREGKLFNDVAVSATNFNQELRITKIDRLEQTADIVNGSKESFIIWIKHDAEGEYLRKAIPGAIEVKGSDKDKVENLLGFGQGKFRVLITKTKIAAMGLNYQNCHNQIFASLDFSFEALYQGIRRSYRFGQTHAVNIWIITTDTMRNVIAAIKKKEADHKEMQIQMIKHSNNLYGQYRNAA